MTTMGTSITDLSILERLIQPQRRALPVSAARALLKIDFEDRDRHAMHLLSQKAQQGTLTPQEQATLDSYERIGHLIDLLHSLARRRLRAHAAES